MDKFENEEKFGFYYESDQDSGSDCDWSPSQESEFETEESCFEETDCTDEEESEEEI